MQAEDTDRKARIAKIKHYKKLKRLQQCRRKTRLNMIAAKMLTYASVPALSMISLADGSTAEARSYSADAAVISIDDNNVDNLHLKSVALSNFDIGTAVNNIVANDGEEFLQHLNRQFADISRHTKGAERKAYTNSLFGNINYCNAAVIKALKAAEVDYMTDFLNNLQNPARCQSFIDYVKQTHPDCIKYVKNISRADLKRGDVLVLENIRRQTSGAITSSGRHTVTFDGEELISFNSESRYKPGMESAHIINMDKIRHKELKNKLQNMDKVNAVFYLITLENKSQLAHSKTKAASPQLLAQNMVRSRKKKHFFCLTNQQHWLSIHSTNVLL